MFRFSVLVAGILLAACRATPHPSTPTPSQGGLSTPKVQQTDHVTRAATIASTVTATAPFRSGPITVGVSLDEAEREVLSWFDPARDPRVEWSKYVRVSELSPLMAQLRPAKVGYLFDRWPRAFAERDSRTLAPVEIVVLASARNFAGLRVATPQSANTPIPGSPPPTEVPALDTVIAVFDALTGERLAASAVIERMYIRPDPLATIEAAPTAMATYSADARTTATPRPTQGPYPTLSTAEWLKGWPDGTFTPRPPTPTATPAPPRVRLTKRNLPAGLRPTFLAYPLAPGSQWTWQTVAQNAGVRWSAQVVTETISAAWLEGDFAVIESDLEVDHPWTSHDATGDFGAVSGPRIRYVSAELIADSPFAIDRAPSFLMRQDRPDSPFSADRIAVEMFVYPLLSPRELAAGVDVKGGPIEFTTGAGTFQGCWELSAWGGSSWGTNRMFCPGVGYVHDHFSSVGTWHLESFVTDLVRWHRAELPEQ